MRGWQAVEAQKKKNHRASTRKSWQWEKESRPTDNEDYYVIMKHGKQHGMPIVEKDVSG